MGFLQKAGRQTTRKRKRHNRFVNMVNNLEDSKLYAIEVSKEDKRQVRMTGKQWKEAIAIKQMAD